MNKSLLIAVSALSFGFASATPLNTASASNPTTFVQQSAVKTRLTKLLGPVNMRFFQKNFKTVRKGQRWNGERVLFHL